MYCAQPCFLDRGFGLGGSSQKWTLGVVNTAVDISEVLRKHDELLVILEALG